AALRGPLPFLFLRLLAGHHASLLGRGLGVGAVVASGPFGRLDIFRLVIDFLVDSRILDNKPVLTFGTIDFPPDQIGVANGDQRLATRALLFESCSRCHVRFSGRQTRVEDAKERYTPELSSS